MLKLLKSNIQYNFDQVAKARTNIALTLTYLWPPFFLIMEKGTFTGPLFQYFCVFCLCVGRYFDQRLVHGLLLAFGLLYHTMTWQFADNHQWLFMYWLLALCLGFISNSSEESMPKQSRSLLAAVFLLATFWKLYDGQYLNGTFFTFAFIADKRIQGFVDHVLRMNFEQVRVQSHISNTTIFDGIIPLFHKTALFVNLRGERLALFISYLTILFEFLTGAFYGLKLYKPQHKLAAYADWVLIVFLVTVYPLLAVHGFAVILIILGLVQTSPKMVKFFLVALVWQLFAYIKF